MNSSGDSSNLTCGSVTGHGNSYVSCIKVNGRPILPPIMSETIRAEMRRYRELAIKVETTIKFKKRPAPTRLSQVPMNTTVTFSPHKDNPSVSSPNPVDSTTFDERVSSITSLPSNFDTIPQETMESRHLTAFDMISDHFTIKKPNQQIPAFPSSDEESVSSNSFRSESGLGQGITYVKLEDESPIEPPPFFQDPPKDEDCQSEAMSLISLDNEEKKEREQVEEEEEEDSNSENHVSGRSSTETYTIEKNCVSSDSENNNDNSNNGNSLRTYFFSPVQSEVSEIVFNTENASTVKTLKKQSYFGSPSSPTDHLADTSTVSSVTSHASTVESFLSPKSTSSKGSVSVRKRFYFSSPETDDPSTDYHDSARSDTYSESIKCGVANLDSSRYGVTNLDSGRADVANLDSARSGITSSDSRNSGVTSDSSTSDITISDSKSSGIAIPDAKRPETPKSDPSRFASTNSDVRSMLPTRIPSPKKIPLTPAKINLMPEIKSPVISPLLKKKVLDVSESVRVLKSPAKKARHNDNERAEEEKNSKSLKKASLASLQATLQNMSPSVFKAPSDARSPLLKGVIFLDPLYRPKRELRIPPEVLNPEMQPKFARATAAAKGFLVRRLLKTEKIQLIIQTIRDTVELVLKLYEEVPQLKVRGWKGVNHEDADLCRRLFQQLTGTCATFHDVFFKLTTPQRMAIIASDREKLKAKEMKTYLSRTARPVRGPSSKHHSSAGSNNLSRRKISTATVKCLERRMSALHS